MRACVRARVTGTDASPRSVHRARIVGFDYLDGLVQLTLQPSVLARPFMTLADLQAGTVLEVGDRRAPLRTRALRTRPGRN